jgi:hypothetical protein
MTLETEGSKPSSQEPATGHYPEPTESTSPPPINLPKIHSHPILPSTPWSSEWSLSFRFSQRNLVRFSILSHACHRPIPCPPHSPWLDLPNDVWKWVKIMKPLTVQLPPFSYYIITLRSKYSYQNPVLKHLLSPPIMWETEFHTHTKQVAKLWCSKFWPLRF